MNRIRRVVLVTTLFLVFFAVGNATPVLFDQLPKNNSYFGRGSVYFYVNITSTGLDTNNVWLSLTSEDAYLNNESWDNYTMQCSQYATDNWLCTKSVSFSIAGSDTLEFFYFTAKDTDYGNLGNSTSPLRFKIDRTPPEISFIHPKNYTYVFGNTSINISATDSVSGINTSSAQFSAAGSVWSPMTSLTGYLNTYTYANDQIISVRARAADNVGNYNMSEVNITIDNEIPSLLVTSPVTGSILNDDKLFSVNVSDRFSGVNTTRVTYFINQSYPLVCSGNVCSSTVKTKNFGDGDYNIPFTVYDNAGNSNSSIVLVTFRNSRPSVILTPKNYVKDDITFTAAIVMPGGIITAVNLIVNATQSLSTAMSCNPGFTQCTYPFNTKTFTDGIYDLRASASNVLGYDIKDTGTLVIDNTNPEIIIESANYTKAILTINVRVNDPNGDSQKVSYTILGVPKLMSCLQQNDVLYCTSQYDFSPLADGPYNITIAATDRLDHATVKSKIIFVDKNPPEFRSLKITPLNPGLPTNVSLEADIVDQGSAVKSVSSSINSPTTTVSTNLVHTSSNWTARVSATSMGAYQVDLTAVDENGNSVTFDNVGYFYLGQLSCGDGVCQSSENYCLCQMDCYAPTCTTGSVDCRSGIPTCLSSSGTVTGSSAANTTSAAGGSSTTNAPSSTTVPGKNVPDAVKTKETITVRELVETLTVVNPVPTSIVIALVIAALVFFKFRKNLKKKEKVDSFFSK